MQEVAMLMTFRRVQQASGWAHAIVAQLDRSGLKLRQTQIYKRQHGYIRQGIIESSEHPFKLTLSVRDAVEKKHGEQRGVSADLILFNRNIKGKKILLVIKIELDDDDDCPRFTLEFGADDPVLRELVNPVVGRELKPCMQISESESYGLTGVLVTYWFFMLRIGEDYRRRRT